MHDGTRVDYLDGTVFSGDGVLPDRWARTPTTAPHVPSDYTGMGDLLPLDPASARTDVLTTHDYLWRWDTDWFWCSRAFGAQNPRRAPAVAQEPAAPDVYWKLVALDRRYVALGTRRRLHGAARRASRWCRTSRCRSTRCRTFLDVLPPRGRASRRSGCARCGSATPTPSWPLYALDPDVTYVNVGFWSTVPLPRRRRPGGGPGQPADRGRSCASSAATSRCTPRRSTTARSSRRSTAATRTRGCRAAYDPERRLAGHVEQDRGGARDDACRTGRGRVHDEARRGRVAVRRPGRRGRRVHGVRREPARPRRLRRPDRRALAARGVAAHVGARAARARPRLRQRRARGLRRPVHRLRPAGPPRHPPPVGGGAGCGSTARSRRSRCAASRRRRRRSGSAGCGTPSGATPTRSATTTT